MELPVRLVRSARVGRRRRSGQLGVDLAQLSDLVICRPARRPDQLDLDELKQRDDLPELLEAQVGDEVALVESVREQTFGGQDTQRLTKWYPADPESRRHLVLADLVSGLECPFHHKIAQRPH